MISNDFLSICIHMDEINVGNNIDVVQSAVRVMLNFVKHLAKCPGKVPARDPSALRFVGMTP